MKNLKVGCELCDAPANMYCESDRASLCWRCDYKVHGANFLVAKHNRSVLCHVCQAVTPWTASGPRLPPSMSLCLSCVPTTTLNNNYNNPNDQQNIESQSTDHNHDHEDSSHDENEEDDYYGNDEDEDEDEEEDDSENQVVPLTSDDSILASSSREVMNYSSSEAEEEGDNIHILSTLPESLKRKRETSYRLM